MLVSPDFMVHNPTESQGHLKPPLQLLGEVVSAPLLCCGVEKAPYLGLSLFIVSNSLPPCAYWIQANDSQKPNPHVVNPGFGGSATSIDATNHSLMCSWLLFSPSWHSLPTSSTVSSSPLRVPPYLLRLEHQTVQTPWTTSLPQKPLPGWQHPASGTWSCLYSSDIQIYAPNPDVPLTSRLTNHLSTWLFYNLKLCVCDWTCSSLVAPTSKTLVTPSHQLLRLKLLGTFVGTFTYILFYWYLHFQNICRVHPYLSTSVAMVEALRVSWFLSYHNQWYKQPSRQHGL